MGWSSPPMSERMVEKTRSEKEDKGKNCSTRTLHHVLDQNTSLSDGLLDFELFAIVGCEREKVSDQSQAGEDEDALDRNDTLEGET